MKTKHLDVNVNVFRWTLLALLTLLFSTPVAAFDETKLSRFDKFSPKHGETFLALPAEQRQQLAFKYLQQDKLPPSWAFFLLADLSTQALDEKTLATYNDLKLYKTLTKKDHKADDWVSEQLEDDGKPAAELCFIRLQQTPTEALPDSTQEDILATLDQVCVHALTVIAQRPDVMEWVITGIEDELHPHHDRLDTFFSQAGLMSRMFFGQRNGYEVGKLTESQQQRLIDAYIKRVFVPNEATDERLSLWHVEQLSSIVKDTEDKAFQQRYIEALAQQTLANTDDVKRVMRALLDFNDQEPAARLFWERGWQHEHADTEALFDTLQEEYGAEALDEVFPEALHEAAQRHIKTHNDLKFAATYMYFIYHAEGGDDWENGLSTADTVLALTGQLSDEQQKDADTDRLLKYIYLQAAGMQYQQDAYALDKTITYLDAASAITAEPLSWYAYITEEKDEERLDQDSDFAAIKQLHTDGQLASIAQWKKDKTPPKKPFKNLTLDTYALFTENSIKYRLWHNADTGEALLLDDNGIIQVFDGYGVNDAHDPEIQFIRLNNEKTYSGERPKLTAELDEWIEYAAKHLFSSEAAQKTPSRLITEFVTTLGDSPLQERLLFAEVDTDGYIASYPDYLEFNRYGQHLLINADIDGSIQQYALTFAAENDATAWMNQLASKTPAQLKRIGLWYRHDEDGDEGVITRHYEHPNDYDQPSITLSALKADFTHPDECTTPIEPDQLTPSPTAFSQREMELYAKGYYMTGIFHAEECQQEKEDKDLESQENTDDKAEPKKTAKTKNKPNNH